MQVAGHQQLGPGPVEDIAPQVDAGGQFDHGQPGGAQFEHASLGDIAHLLAAPPADAARPGDLGDLGQEFGDRAVPDDLQAAVGDSQVLAACGELAREDQVAGVRGDVGEPAHPGGHMGGAGHQRDVDIAVCGHLQETEQRNVDAAALQQGELVGSGDYRVRIVGRAEGFAGDRQSADRALLDDPGDLAMQALLKQNSRHIGRDPEPQVGDVVLGKLQRGPAGDHLLDAELDGIDPVDGFVGHARQCRIVLDARHLTLGGIEHDRIHQGARHVHRPGRVVVGTQPFDLGDHQSAVVMGRVGGIQGAEQCGLVLEGQVAEGIGGGGPDERHIHRNGGQEKPFAVVDPHQPDEFGADPVHPAALQTRVEVAADADIGKYARLPGGGRALQLKHQPGGDQVGGDLVGFEHFAHRRFGHAGRARGIGPAEDAAQQTRFGQVIHSGQAVGHVARVDGMQRGQPAGMPGGLEMGADRGQQVFGQSDRRGGRHRHGGAVRDQGGRPVGGQDWRFTHRCSSTGLRCRLAAPGRRGRMGSPADPCSRAGWIGSEPAGFGPAVAGASPSRWLVLAVCSCGGAPPALRWLVADEPAAGRSQA